MAKQLATNPAVITSAEAPPVTVFNHWTKLAQIEMQGYAADSDAATFTDINGNFVAGLNGKTDLSTERTGKIGWVNGLICTALPSGGYVVIYFE